MDNRKARIVLIGETGNGKSSLGNFILGKECFKVSNKKDSCTKEPIIQNKIDDPSVSVIDTPGYFDSDNKDDSQLEKMIEYFKKIGDIQLVVLILNFHQTRLNENIRKMIKHLCGVFPKDLEHHIAIVVNKYDYDEAAKNIEDYLVFKNDVPEYLMKLISKETGNALYLNPPIFFTNSKKKDEYSKKEIERLINYAKGCGIIN